VVGKDVIQKMTGGVSALIRNRATAAIMHLIGSYASDVLAKSQSAKDERDARSTIIAAVAKAAGEKAASDPEVVDRMINRLAGAEVRKQENREAVAVEAIEHLSEATEEIDQTARNVDEDWLNIFGDFAERASAESVRDLWARVLAGEIRRPGTFSLFTLHFISLLDAHSAALINKILPWVVDFDWIPNGCKSHGIQISDLIFLEQIGFCSATDETLAMHFEPQNGIQALRMGELAMVVDNDGKKLSIGASPLSLAGKELCKIIRAEPEIDGMIEIVKGKNPKSIKLGKVKSAQRGFQILGPLEIKYERPG